MEDRQAEKIILGLVATLKEVRDAYAAEMRTTDVAKIDAAIAGAAGRDAEFKVGDKVWFIETMWGTPCGGSIVTICGADAEVLVPAFQDRVIRINLRKLGRKAHEVWNR